MIMTRTWWEPCRTRTSIGTGVDTYVLSFLQNNIPSADRYAQKEIIQITTAKVWSTTDAASVRGDAWEAKEIACQGQTMLDRANNCHHVIARSPGEPRTRLVHWLSHPHLPTSDTPQLQPPFSFHANFFFVISLCDCDLHSTKCKSRVFFDEIIAYSKRLTHLKVIFQVLKESRLFINQK